MYIGHTIDDLCEYLMVLFSINNTWLSIILLIFDYKTISNLRISFVDKLLHWLGWAVFHLNHHVHRLVVLFLFQEVINSNLWKLLGIFIVFIWGIVIAFIINNLYFVNIEFTLCLVFIEHLFFFGFNFILSFFVRRFRSLYIWRTTFTHWRVWWTRFIWWRWWGRRWRRWIIQRIFRLWNLWKWGRSFRLLNHQHILTSIRRRWFRRFFASFCFFFNIFIFVFSLSTRCYCLLSFFRRILNMLFLYQIIFV